MLFLTFRRIMRLFFTAPIVKWISQLTSDQLFWVRVLVGAQCYRAQNTAYLSSVLGSTSGILYIYVWKNKKSHYLAGVLNRYCGRGSQCLDGTGNGDCRSANKQHDHYDSSQRDCISRRNHADATAEYK